MAFCPGMPWGAAYPCGQSIGGLMDELSGRLMAMSPPMAEVRPCALENFGPEIQYDHDSATIMMFEMLEKAGVRVHPGTTVTRPLMEGSRIDALEVYDRRGPRIVRPRIVIDCSGDGDVSAQAGVPFTLGDARGNMMAVTLSFVMEGADWSRVFADGDPYFREHAARGIAEGRLHPDLHQLYLMKGFHENTVFCNSVAIRGVDGTRAEDVAEATQEGRRRCRQLAEFLRADVPGFERARMTQLGPTVGVRETRRLEGIHRVTGAELAAATKFEDGIVACDNPIDDVMRGDDMTHDAIVGQGSYYTIPFRSLVPRRIENLMFAGRIISADAMAFASVRGMPQCMTMGQATGVAAALAIRDGCSVQAVDIAELVRLLQAQGVRGIGGAPLAA